MKRGDVHATESDDVVFVHEAEAAANAVNRFRQRGIARAVLQRHIAGDVIKFYAVGDDFLAWYPASGTCVQLATPTVRRSGRRSTEHPLT